MTHFQKLLVALPKIWLNKSTKLLFLGRGDKIMITIKRLSQCTLEDAVVAWNKGFEGYYFDMTTTVDFFTRRLILEGLSPTLSVIAYDEERPVGNYIKRHSPY
nr:hypothetical protein [Fredinandcohnia onubensis]